VSAAGSRPRRSGWPASGQHLLRSDALAEELVALAGIGPADLVLEIGAGRGRLTAALALAARQVVAVELDPTFADGLRARFAGHTSVEILHGDVLQVPLPSTPFRAFGNVPFAISTAILRRLLDDPTSGLVGADLLLQYEAARKRASVWPSHLLTLGWLPWWELRLVRHLHAAAFQPPPSVDAGVLSVTPRPQPLLPAEQRDEYRSLLRQAFRRADRPVLRALGGRVTRGEWKRTMMSRGLFYGARPTDLDVFDWVALFAAR